MYVHARSILRTPGFLVLIPDSQTPHGNCHPFRVTLSVTFFLPARGPQLYRSLLSKVTTRSPRSCDSSAGTCLSHGTDFGRPPSADLSLRGGVVAPLCARPLVLLPVVRWFTRAGGLCCGYSSRHAGAQQEQRRQRVDMCARAHVCVRARFVQRRVVRWDAGCVALVVVGLPNVLGSPFFFLPGPRSLFPCSRWRLRLLRRSAAAAAAFGLAVSLTQHEHEPQNLPLMTLSCHRERTRSPLHTLQDEHSTMTNVFDKKASQYQRLQRLYISSHSPP
ncbi:hypothetical protein CCHR01_16382 [Colletotrichum chrysophilum]|uniref:Uncharacterized protein n=1 Tax=Colletotrichum chrysophilum TaxID=1836956 RepID=A0AAD9A3V8_9PEZI|nr:hypothetical protein CCHR01_16382 [Colletotrichum chrysophilum]